MVGIGGWSASRRIGATPRRCLAGAAALIWVLLGLPGCARVDDEERVTWTCARTADGKSWDCARQRTRNGVPLGPAPAAAASPPAAIATAPPGGGATAPAAAPEPHLPPAPQPPPRAHWNERLPGLQEGQIGVEALPVTSPALQAEPPGGAAPEPEPALARWTGTLDSPPRPQPAPDLHDQQPTAISATPEPGSAHSGETERRTAPSRPPVTAGPYTVQIGAFRSAADAHAYIAAHGLGELPLAVQAVERGSRQYQVVTFGSFATVRAATAAWRRAVAGRELDFWVRPIR